MTVTVSIINSSFYTIDFALARRLQRFLAVDVLDGNTANLLVRASVHTPSNTYVALSMKSVKGTRSMPSPESLFHTEQEDATCSVTKASSWCMHPWRYMQRELARSVRRRRMGDAALYPSRRPSVLGVVGTSPSSPDLRRSLFLLDSRKRGLISVVLLSAISIQKKSSMDYEVVVEDVTGCLMFLSFPSHAFASSASGCVCRLGSCCEAGCSEGLSCNSVQGTSMAPAPSCYQHPSGSEKELGPDAWWPVEHAVAFESPNQKAWRACQHAADQDEVRLMGALAGWMQVA